MNAKVKKLKIKELSFEKICLDFTIQQLEGAIRGLEGIGAASDDAQLPNVSARIFASIDELKEILEEAKQ